MSEEWRSFGNTLFSDKQDMIVIDLPDGVKMAAHIAGAINENERLRVSGTAFMKAAAKFAAENKELRDSLRRALDELKGTGATMYEEFVAEVESLLQEPNLESENDHG